MKDRVTYEEAIKMWEYKDGMLFWKVGRQRKLKGKRAGNLNKGTGKRMVLHRPYRYLEHRLIWLICKGEWPKGIVMHLDGDKLNNNIENLHDGSMSENTLSLNDSLRKNNKSGIKGISIIDPKHGKLSNWCADLTRNGKRYKTYHKTKEEAIEKLNAVREQLKLLPDGRCLA